MLLLIMLSIGPLELTRRQKVLVWDDEVEVQEEIIHDTETDAEANPPSPRMSVNSVPIPQRPRSHSTTGEFPPPMRRTSTDASGLPRPVPFAAKFQRIHPGTTGVTILEHLERLDAVEASLQRLGVDEEEVDVGEAIQPRSLPITGGSHRDMFGASPSTAPNVTSPFSPPGSPLPTVPEAPSSASSILEEDLAAMSKSTSHVEGLRHSFTRDRRDTIRTSNIDWIQPPSESNKRTVIVEVGFLRSFSRATSDSFILQRLETVNKKPLCSCW
jgi:phosphatidylinositol 4-kinase type 2